MDYRNFEVTSDVAGEKYRVQFRWLQTAISLRHSDTVDVKFQVDGGGKVVAVPHGTLERACARSKTPLTDELCLRIAAEHLRHALETGEDAEKDLLTLTEARVEELVERQLEPAEPRSIR